MLGSRHHLAADLLTEACHGRYFQTWLALVDQDRFHGKAREKAEPVEIADIMRRMVKEDLITFEGTKLFPELV